MASPSAELRAFFAAAVPDCRQEAFLTWLADVDALVRDISGGALDVLDVTNPGWDALWAQDTPPAKALDHVRALDFNFEGYWELREHESGR